MIPGITYSEIMPLVIVFMEPFSFLVGVLLAIGIVFIVLYKIVGLARS